jgi:CRP-like cAMP-binding protein
MEISEIFKDLSFSKEEHTLMAKAFEKIHLNKGSSLLKTGDPVEYQYFIAQGCLRTFYMDKSAKEHTVQFAVQDWWISDYTAFFSNSKATLNIECLQDSQVFKVSRTNLEGLFVQIPRLETFFRKKIRGSFF